LIIVTDTHERARAHGRIDGRVV